MASDMPTFGANSAAQVAKHVAQRPDREFLFSHCCCSSPHAAEIWAPFVSTTLRADAADENRDRDLRPVLGESGPHRAAPCRAALRSSHLDVARISPRRRPKAVNRGCDRFSLHEGLHKPAGPRSVRARRLVSIGTLNKRYAIPEPPLLFHSGRYE